MNKFYKASVMIFTSAIGLAGCNEQADESTAKIEVSPAAAPSVMPPVAAPVAKAVITPTPVVASVPTPVVPPKPYEATLAEGIDFNKPGYPTFIAEVTGMSGYEANHRWSDATQGKIIKFGFKKPLPKKFTLEIVASAFGPNDGLPIKVQVGSVEKTFTITNNKTGIQPYSIPFKTDGKSVSLELTPPKPTSPVELNPKSGDARKLAINFISLKIKP